MKDITLDRVKKDSYKITDKGEVWSNFKNGFMLQRKNKGGYNVISLRDENGKVIQMLVHRLVLMTYEPNNRMSELEVNHKDGNKSNNSLSNLEWVTHQENIEHSNKTGLNKGVSGELNGMAEKSEEFILNIIQLLLNGKTNTEIEIETGYSSKEVSKIRNKTRWKYLTENLDFPPVKRKRIRTKKESVL